MAFVLKDRVKETTTTTGTGSVTLAGASTGFQSFNSAIGTSNTTYYCIAGQGTSEWEVGLGTLSASTTLARTTVYASSNAGSLVNFSAGTKDVFVTFPATAASGPAFSATPSTTQAVTTATYTKVDLGTENFDTNNNFATSRFTPTVAGYYQLNGSIYSLSSSGADYIWAIIYKNGAAYATGSSASAASAVDGISVASTLVYLNGSTDYVELYCYLTGVSPVIQNGYYTQFSGFFARGA